MTEEHKLLEKHVKKTTIIANLISLVVGVGCFLFIIYGFYYETSDSISTNTEDIKNMENRFNVLEEKYNDTEVFQGVSKTEILQLQKDVNTMQQSLDKQNDKLDRILMQTK